jgi:hypothetical protein
LKIVADESVDKQIVDRLRSDGHDVLFIAELDPGIDDDAVLLRSREAHAILLTAALRGLIVFDIRARRRDQQWPNRRALVCAGMPVPL